MGYAIPLQLVAALLNDFKKDYPPALSGGGLEMYEGHGAHRCGIQLLPQGASHSILHYPSPSFLASPGKAWPLCAQLPEESLSPSIQPSGRGWDAAFISPSTGVLPAFSRAAHWVLHLLCVLDGFSWLWPILAPEPSIISAQNLQATANSSSGNLRPTLRH